MNKFKDIPEGKCRCSICGVVKDNNEFCFYKTRFTSDGYRLRTNTNCKSCSKKLIKQRALIRQAVTEPRPAAGAPCACCGKSSSKHEFDHDHATGKFRGYICKDCNVGLGKFGDSPEGLVAALMYVYENASVDQKRSAVNKLTEYIVNGK